MSEKRGTWNTEESNGKHKNVYNVTYNGVDYIVKTAKSSKNYWIWCRNVNTGSQKLRATKSIGIHNGLSLDEVKRIIESNMETIRV